MYIIPLFFLDTYADGLILHCAVATKVLSVGEPLIALLLYPITCVPQFRFQAQEEVGAVSRSRAYLPRRLLCTRWLRLNCFDDVDAGWKVDTEQV